MRTLVVNCSTPHYSLGAHKLADWLREQGDDVTLQEGDHGAFTFGFDRVCLSVIFSWHAPVALEIANRVRSHAEVWCGGPGMAALASWWKEQTGGLPLTVGLDQRFERQRGDYEWCFASRGCPVNCSFCIVPRIEGTDFTLDWDFRPAPKLADNNLSALPVEFQEHIVRRYTESGVRLVDANSGFEPRTFDGGTYRRWKPMIRRPAVWRFALDEQREAGDVFRMMQILAPEPSRMKRCYVLIGNEPIASCYERALNVIAWGGEPYCQPVMRLNVLDRGNLWVRHDWTPRLLRDFARYFNKVENWKSFPLEEYRPRKHEPPPFRSILTRSAA